MGSAEVRRTGAGRRVLPLAEERRRDLHRGCAHAEEDTFGTVFVGEGDPRQHKGRQQQEREAALSPVGSQVLHEA